MAATLLQCQKKFALMVPRLILQAAALGYGVTLGDANRDKRLYEIAAWAADNGFNDGAPVPTCHPRSLHFARLAIDLNLFKEDGRYITDDEGHRELHAWWEGIGGAKMIDGDANHYSLQWTPGVR